jgi:hypothetical protein
MRLSCHMQCGVAGHPRPSLDRVFAEDRGRAILDPSGNPVAAILFAFLYIDCRKAG